MTILTQNGHFGQKSKLRHLLGKVKKREIGPQKRDPKMVKNGIFGFFDMISVVDISMPDVFRISGPRVSDS